MATMAGRRVRKTLSKGILEMKFMQKSRDAAQKAAEAEEARRVCSNDLTELMRRAGARTVLEPSFAPCEELSAPRQSFHGANPDVEKFLQEELAAKNVKMEPDADIQADEVARVTHAGLKLQPPKKKMSLYKTLNCSPDATPEQLRQAFHHAARSKHPDKGGTSEAFSEITAAFQILSSPTARQVYDASLIESGVPVQADLPSTALSLDMETGTLKTACRCSGEFVLMKSDLKDNEPLLVPCDSCSLYLRVWVVPPINMASVV